MPKRNSQPGPQGQKAAPLPDGHTIDDWARIATDWAYPQLPKPQRKLISREMYELLAVLCFRGENVHRGDATPEKIALLANRNHCESLEFGVTIEFMRLVRDKFGAQIGWRANQSRVAKGLPPRLKQSAVELALRNPALRAAIPSDEESLFEGQAGALGERMGAEVPGVVYKKARRSIRKQVRKI